ncbi:MAG: outer membrane beta-barrel protein [Rhodospirillaceae bacterium]|nr:outer membrane beta-barrel protein [Rhodospirillaceae bacterium]
MTAPSRRGPACPGLSRLLAAVIAGLLGWTASTAPADAQTPRRTQTVSERPRPLFDPIGIPMGPWGIFPSLTVSMEIDDNIFADDDIVRSDLAFVVEPALQVREELEGVNVSALAFARTTQYVDNRSESNEEFGIATRVDYEIDSTNVLGGAARFERQTVSRSDPEDAGLDEPLQRNLVDLQLNYGHTFGRLSLQVAGRARIEDFLPADEDAEDRQRYAGTTRLSYEISPRVDAFVEGQFSALRYSSRLSDDGEANTYTALVGSAFDLDGVIFGEVGVGVFREDFLDPAERDFTGLALNTSVDWNVTGLTTLRASLVRRDEATRVDGATSRVRTEIGVGATHELLRNLLVDVDASYRIDQFEGIDRSDQTVAIGAGVEYLFNRYLSAFARYEFTTRGSDDPDSDFVRNRGILGITARL